MIISGLSSVTPLAVFAIIPLDLVIILLVPPRLSSVIPVIDGKAWMEAQPIASWQKSGFLQLFATAWSASLSKRLRLFGTIRCQVFTTGVVTVWLCGTMALQCAWQLDRPFSRDSHTFLITVMPGAAAWLQLSRQNSMRERKTCRNLAKTLISLLPWGLVFHCWA